MLSKKPSGICKVNGRLYDFDLCMFPGKAPYTVPDKYTFIGEGTCYSINGKLVDSNMVCHFYKENERNEHG